MTRGVLTLIVGDSEVTGEWSLEDETLNWRIGEQAFKIESQGDLARQVLGFLRILSKRIYNKNTGIKACLTCEYFSMSGMARDMGRGQRGVCQYHQKGVEICYLCEAYSEKKNG